MVYYGYVIMLQKFKSSRYVFILLFVGALITAAAVASRHPSFAVLQPAGTIAYEQRKLIYFGLLLSLIVVVPVFGLTAYIVWKYRATKTSSTYRPDWDHSRTLESIWWGLPCLIILILGIVTWQSSHHLDPYRPISSSQPTLRVQAVALQWKWLFLYPDLGIASVNYLKIPVDRPVHFEITADAPMNSFWIPRLGGQVYAMPGMTTQLNLQATSPGMYRGSSANLSGTNFADMHFMTEAVSGQDFSDWSESVRIPTDTGTSRLSEADYAVLAEPNVASSTKIYNAYDNQLFDSILAKYMAMGSHDQMKSTEGAQ